MAEFESKFSGMRYVVEREKKLSAEVYSLEEDIRNVISQLKMNSNAIVQVKHSLNNELQNVGTLKERLNVLSSTLEQITTLYESTENKILGKETTNKSKGLSDLKDKVNEIREKLSGKLVFSAYSKDPVNLCNGNYIYEKTFLHLETESQLEFSIFYNMLNSGSGVLGKGWMHNWEVCLRIDDEQIVMVKEDASEMRFRKNENGYKAEKGTFSILERNEDGYCVITREQQKWFFDSNGTLMTIELNNGVKVLLKYSGNRLLQSVSDNAGNYIEFEYSDNDKINLIRDYTGRELQLQYQDDLLSSVCDNQGREVNYQYDENYNLVELINARDISSLKNEYDESGRTVLQKFPDGGVVQYEYLDDKNQVIMTEQNGNRIIYEHDELYRNTRNIYEDGEESFTYNENDQRTSFTDKRGNTSYYDYDKQGNLSKFISPLKDKIEINYTATNQLKNVRLNGEIIHKAAYDEKNRQIWTEDALGNRETYEYSELNGPIRWIRPDNSKIDIKYSEGGNISQVTNTMGGKHSYEYNERNQVIRETDSLGNSTCYEYDENDKLLCIRNAEGNEQRYKYDACGNIIRVTDFNGGVTEIEYNEMNKPVCIIDPEGACTRMEYDTMWNLIKKIDGNGGTTQYEYDLQQHLIRVTDPEGGINQMKYDACGNMTERIDPEGGIHVIGYDSLNRPNYVKDPVSMEVKASYDALGNVTEVLYSDGTKECSEYDLLGNILSYSDREGYERKFSYDCLGNLEKIEDFAGPIEYYTYYPGGLLKKEWHMDGKSREFWYDENENIVQILENEKTRWKFSYDSMGRVIKAEQEEGICENYSYDALGNVVSVINGEGEKTSYHYNLSGLLDLVTDASGNQTSYKYDKCRQLIEICQPVEGKFDINVLNKLNQEQKEVRITRYQRDFVGNIINVIDPAGAETKYSYDKCGRITGKIDPDGNKTICSYNLDGTVHSCLFSNGEQIIYEYDSFKHLIKANDWNGTTEIHPDIMGRVKKIINPEQETLDFEWGIRGENTKVIYPDGMQVIYKYDEGLRVTECSNGKESVEYSYYPDGKLKNKIFPEKFVQFYAYDRAGNLSELSYCDSEKQLEKISFEYDRCGRKSKIVKEGTQKEFFSYSYDPTGELIKVLKNNQPVESYSYDRFGNRVSSEIYGEHTKYQYNSVNQLIGSEKNNVISKFCYDKRGNMTEEVINNMPIRQMAFDVRNRIISVKTEDIVAHYKNDCFGNRISAEWNSGAGEVYKEQYFYDATKEQDHLFCVRRNGKLTNIWRDGGILAETENQTTNYLINDEKTTPLYRFSFKESEACNTCDAFGNIISRKANSFWGFAGYRTEPTGQTLYANEREYDTSIGRFLSKDPWAGVITIPLTINAYAYCLNDPINRYDPTGQIVAWLAGGIVGAATNVVTKAAGDIVNSVAAGKWTGSSWQSYVGSATGGFVTGSTFAITGNMALAGAAGSATETFVGEGLSMVTGAKGYQKSDGYSWGKLVANTAKNAAIGAGSGYIFGKAAKYIKIPGITKGRGSMEAVWKQVMTKASKGQIANITLKTMGKGLLAYGGVKFFDQILQKGVKKTKEIAEGKFWEWLIPTVHAAEKDASDYLSQAPSAANCPAEGN